MELIGNLTRDPELRFTPSGAAVCTFGLATNRTYVSEGERKEEVDFHRLVSWNKLAELCNQLLKKGNKVFISGRLQTRSWEGQDGEKRNVTEIVIEDMILLSPKSVSNGGQGEVSDVTIDELPKEKPVEKHQTEEPKEAVKEDKAEKQTAVKTPQEDLKEDEDLPF